MSVVTFPSNPEPYDSTEDAAAECFARYHPYLRWCQTWGKWLVWNDTVWRPDDTIIVYDMIRRYCRKNSECKSDTDTDRKRQCTASFVAAVERFCKADRRYAARPDQFDNDDWLLNTQGGLVDLKTGAIQEHDPKAYCTRVTAVAPKGDCHRWREFLSEISDCDVQLIDFLQRMTGYCLTGSTREHALFFAYGTGGNGKSVFMNTLTGILGNYAATSPMETFTESRHDRHPTELAMLEGARLVVAQETEQRKRWAQSRIKALTGGDPVTARYMRQDFFSFVPKFKLLIAGNTKPKLDTVDEAMRRRFHVIPLTVQIAAEKRDPNLAETLQLEWPGILKWAIEGAIQYQEIGLAPPPSVAEATASYLESQDVFADWLSSECEFSPDYCSNPKSLFNSWKRFAEDSGGRPGRLSEFGERMQANGFTQARTEKRGRHWRGIRVTQNNDL